MFSRDFEKIVLVTNNRMVIDKYRDRFDVREEDSYEAVLVRVRDLAYSGYTLLTHPQASSIKPNRTPVRSVMLYPAQGEDDRNRDYMMVTEALEGYRKWQEISPSPEKYPEDILKDYETVDLSLTDGVVQNL